MSALLRRAIAAAVVIAATGAVLCGCGWHGPNSLPLPGTAGHGPGAFTVQAQLADVANLKENSRVRVGDVVVGTVINIQRQDWHALVTMQVSGDVDLPGNATAKLGQTTLLGSMHIELAPPTNAAPTGKLHNGSVI